MQNRIIVQKRKKISFTFQAAQWLHLLVKGKKNMPVCIESATVDLKIVKQRRAGRKKPSRTETEDHDRPQNEQRAEV